MTVINVEGNEFILPDSIRGMAYREEPVDDLTKAHGRATTWGGLRAVMVHLCQLGHGHFELDTEDEKVVNSVRGVMHHPTVRRHIPEGKTLRLYSRQMGDDSYTVTISIEDEDDART